MDAIEEIHQLAHLTPGYVESLNEDKQLVTLALAAQELVLMNLGLAIIMMMYPCLAQDAYTFFERVEEIVDAVWPVLDEDES